jgi:hypothetical protein
MERGGGGGKNGEAILPPFMFSLLDQFVIKVDHNDNFTFILSNKNAMVFMSLFVVKRYVFILFNKNIFDTHTQ